MGEETKEINVPSKEELLKAIEGEEEISEEEEVATKEEFSDIEKEAREHGWNPDGVEGRRTLTAEEFMDRQPLYDEIRALKRQTRKLQDGMSALTKHQERIRQQEREQTIRELKQKKVEALEAGDNEKVVEIDDQILDAKTTNNEDTDEIANAAFEEWVEKNDWYQDDPEMKMYADMVGAGYNAVHNPKSLAEVYEHVTKEVKARYPNKFPDKRRERQSAVESASRGRGTGKKSKYSVKDLPEEDRVLMRTILRATPNMTEQQYLDDYFKYQ